MLTEEAKRYGRRFLAFIHNSDILVQTIVEIMVLLSDHNVESKEAYQALLEATKDCRTDAEFLSAVRAVLEPE